jgi:hypothetical protein
MKYINFNKHSDFQPMFNPAEMVAMGVYGGSAFKYGDKANMFPKLPWDLMKLGGMFTKEKNCFKVEANHDYYSLGLGLNQFWTPVTWFEWFTDFYYNYPSRKPGSDWDYFYISYWFHYLDAIYETRADKIFVAEPETMQVLLEIGYDGRFKPNFDTKWMLEKYPLKQLPPRTSAE